MAAETAHVEVESSSILDPLAKYKDKKQWVAWNLELNQDGVLTKVPKNPRTGHNASVNRPSTWGTYEEACRARDKHNFSGIGIMLIGLTGIDFDHVLKDGELDPIASGIVDYVDSYKEISPSGDGLHQLVEGSSTLEWNKIKDAFGPGTTLEMYSATMTIDEKGRTKIEDGRWFSVTGNVFGEIKPIEKRDEQVQNIQQRYKKEKKKSTRKGSTPQPVGKTTEGDVELEKRIRRNKVIGDIFEKYAISNDKPEDDTSARDIAFCCELAKCTRDAAQIERFLRKFRPREKLDQNARVGETYAQGTVREALERTELEYPNKLPLPLNEAKKPAYDIIAMRLIDEFKIKRIDNKICIYKDGTYVNHVSDSGGNYLTYVIDDRYSGILNKTCTEIMGSIERKCYESTPKAESRYIGLNNGIFDLNEGKLIDFDPDIVITNKIPWDYVEGAHSDILDSFLEDVTLGDTDMIALLEEMVGYCFLRDCRLRKAFFLIGEGLNGKSTFITMLRNVLGSANCCNVDPKNLDGDRHRFMSAELDGRLANLADDISDTFTKDSSNFKKTISGDEMTVERKGGHPFQIKPYATHVCSVNTMPRIGDAGKAIISRMIIIPFDRSFETPDPLMKDKLLTEEVAEAMVFRGITALRRLIESSSFTMSKRCSEELDKYQSNNDSVKVWYEDYTEKGQTIEMKTPGEIYPEYRVFCDLNGYKTPAINVFSQRLMQLTGMKTKKTRIKTDNGERNVKVYRQETD